MIGIDGDASLPLSRDRADPAINDADGDGEPGVTVRIFVNRFISGEIYLARREVFENHVTLREDGSLIGHVRDASEQLVIGASSRLFDADADPRQSGDAGLSPLVLVPVPASMDSCEALMSAADTLFPGPPAFF